MIKVRKMNPDERDAIERELKWAHRWGAAFNGFPFSDSLVSSEGASFIIYVPPGTSQEEIAKAKDQCRHERDMLYFMAVEIPADML
jgi:hypothetical protein